MLIVNSDENAITSTFKVQEKDVFQIYCDGLFLLQSPD